MVKKQGHITVLDLALDGKSCVINLDRMGMRVDERHHPDTFYYI